MGAFIEIDIVKLYSLDDCWRTKQESDDERTWTRRKFSPVAKGFPMRGSRLLIEQREKTLVAGAGGNRNDYITLWMCMK